MARLLTEARHFFAALVFAAYKYLDERWPPPRLGSMAREHRFAELLSRVAREITLRQSSDVCCGDLTLEQFQTLRTVDASDQLSIGALSTKLRVDFSTTSGTATSNDPEAPRTAASFGSESPPRVGAPWRRCGATSGTC
jgi:hypothetical protein